MTQVMNEQKMLNGVNVTSLEQTIAAVQTQPGLAQFQFRSRNQWITGGHNCSTIQEFHAGGQPDEKRVTPFVLHADEPPVLLGEDKAPNPVEFILHALAACLTTSLTYHAAARGIRMDAIESNIEGDLDLRGFLGLDVDVRKGYSGIRVCMKVKSAAAAEQLKELTKFSPVFDIVSNPVPVTVDVEVQQ
jgi:uncharacterized OsmC-like protein